MYWPSFVRNHVTSRVLRADNKSLFGETFFWPRFSLAPTCKHGGRFAKVDDSDSDQSDFEGFGDGVFPNHYDSSDIEVSSVNTDDLSDFEPDIGEENADKYDWISR